MYDCQLLYFSKCIKNVFINHLVWMVDNKTATCLKKEYQLDLNIFCITLSEAALCSSFDSCILRYQVSNDRSSYRRQKMDLDYVSTPTGGKRK